MLLEEVYSGAPVVRTGRHLTTVNEFTDQQPALRPGVLAEARDRLLALGRFDTDKILVEEDKGALLAAAVALATHLPLAVARWYPYQLPADADGTPPIEVDIDSEYFSGHLYVNGIGAGDRITIVDDTLSTGGTLDALIRAVNSVGARVEEILVAVEKVSSGGRARIRTAHGIEVESAIRIDVDPATMRAFVVDGDDQAKVA
jgi:adenine phosphoribosyltransferase